MKNSIFKISILTMVLGVVFIACEKNTDKQPEELNQINSDIPTEHAVLPENVSVKSIEVARIQKNGHDYKFTSIGNEGDMLVSEEFYGNAKKSSEKSAMHDGDKPLDIFIRITDPNIDIPALIAKTSTPSHIKASGRKVQDMQTSLKILDPNYSEPNIDTQKMMNCTAAVPFSTFANVNCQAPVVSTPASIEFCDPAAQNTLTRRSFFGGNWVNSNGTFTTTNHCRPFRLRLYSWVGGAWILNTQINYYGSGTVNHIYVSPVNTERRVRRNSLGPLGRFRSFTKFL